MSLFLLKANNQLLQLPFLRDGKDESIFVDDAVVTFTLCDSNSVPVAGVASLTLAYVAGSNGVYEGELDSTFNPLVGSYIGVVVAVSGGKTYTKKYKVKVVENFDGKVPYLPYDDTGVGDSYMQSVTRITTDTTMLASHRLVLIDATDGPVTYTLLSPGTAGVAGHVYRFKRVDASENAVVIAGVIDGETEWDLVNQYQVLSISSDATAWFNVGGV